jgi:transcriptional regulator with XRE-family HTH domain
MAGARKQIEHDEIVRRFGERLREVRLSRGMTQAELSRRAEVSEAYIGRLERGRAAPGIDLVAKLAHALGAAAAELLPGTTQPDAVAVLREQARKLFNDLIRTEDRATLSLLSQFLARLSETAPAGD